MLSAQWSHAEETMPASSEFAIDLYHQLDTQPGNVFFSPLSIRSALAMTSAGAKGKTLEEMNQVLRLSGPNPHEAMGEMLRELAKEPKERDAKLVLRIANAIWGQERYPFDPAYVKLVREQYQAEARSVDFGNEPAARKAINDWVEEKTNKKIVDLIPAGILNHETRLVLTNAVYFNARWEHEFSKESTSDQPFHVSMDKTTSVPTMRQTAHFGYAETDDLQAIDMPYAGHDTSMLILLPKAGDGLGAMEKNLSAKQLAQVLQSIQYRRIDLSLPRFKIEQSAALSQVLQALGMKLAFDADKADFSGMCTAEPLYIGEVLHKAFVRVDEEGTEAAAATAVMMGAGAAMIREEPLRVQVDRPFVFVIRDQKTGEILFMGRVMNPAG
jgi:serpin B